MAKGVRLYDACFPQNNSATCAEDNAERHPSHFQWCRDDDCDSLYTWFTNWTLRDPRLHGYPASVAWLLEPPSIEEWPYKWVIKNRRLFDAVLTYDARLLELDDNVFKFCPHGGSWIDWDLWKVYRKKSDICMIISDKDEAVGHQMRQDIVEVFKGYRDIKMFGPSHTRLDRKIDALRHYRYAIVVESIKMDYYFSEKLIDCFATGTVPIYWGCPSISDYFDYEGIISFNDLGQLSRIINSVGVADYRTRMLAIIENKERAKKYRMAEDWAFEKYPELFR